MVIPAHNAQATLPACVRSAWNAGATQVIVVDDGSSDRTGDVARIAGATVITQINRGASQAREQGIRRANASFIIQLDADDELRPEGVLDSIQQLIADDGLVAVVGTTKMAFRRALHRYIKPWVEGIECESLLRRGMSPGPPAAQTWRLSALLAALDNGAPLLRPPYAEDYEVLIRGAIRGRIGCNPAVVCTYHHGGRSSRNPLDDNTHAERVRRYYAGILGLNIRTRGSRELRALAYLRKAHDRPGILATPTRLWFYAAALLLHPHYAHRALRRLTRL